MLPGRANRLAEPLSSSGQIARPLTGGWRVLAALQFIAAGSLVLALASHVFSPQLIRAFLLQGSIHRVSFGSRRVACVGYRHPVRTTQASKAQQFVPFERTLQSARYSFDEDSLLLVSDHRSDVARAPPA